MKWFYSAKGLFLLRGMTFAMLGFAIVLYGRIVPRYLDFWATNYPGADRLAPFAQFVRDAADLQLAWKVSLLLVALALLAHIPRRRPTLEIRVLLSAIMVLGAIVLATHIGLNEEPRPSSNSCMY